MRPAASPVKVTGEVRVGHRSNKKVLTGAKPRIFFFLILGAGLSPAEGGAEPTAGSAFNKVISPSLLPRTRSDNATPLEFHDLLVRHREQFREHLPVVLAEQRRGSIRAQRSIGEARDGAGVEMRPDDGALDRDKIIAALDL